MQIRCTYCQNMFAISREEMLAGLEHMEENKLAYYDAHCPRCRRANRVERNRMERSFPDWKEAIKAMAKEARQSEIAAMEPTHAQQLEKPAAAAKTMVKTAKKLTAPAKVEKKPASLVKKSPVKQVKKPLSPAKKKAPAKPVKKPATAKK